VPWLQGAVGLETLDSHCVSLVQRRAAADWWGQFRSPREVFLRRTQPLRRRPTDHRDAGSTEFPRAAQSLLAWHVSAQSEADMTLTRAQIEALVMRVQNDFLAMPALKLPLGKASHRFGLDIESCRAILDALVDARVLTMTSEGAYVRLVPSRPFAVPMAKAYAA